MVSACPRVQFRHLSPHLISWMQSIRPVDDGVGGGDLQLFLLLCSNTPSKLWQQQTGKEQLTLLSLNVKNNLFYDY